MMEWISVKDRMPGKQTERYLVKTKCSHFAHKTLAFNWPYPCNKINIAYYDDWSKWNYGTQIDWDPEIEVTHWMPLPEVPKGEE